MKFLILTETFLNPIRTILIKRMSFQYHTFYHKALKFMDASHCALLDHNLWHFEAISS